MADESVSEWLVDLKAGSETAARHVWERYFEKLVHLARLKLGAAPRRVADEEDVALSALDSFCRHAAGGRFPQLEDRDDLWKLLFTITERKAAMQVKHERRQKRGGGRHDEQLYAGSDSGEFANHPIAREPTPDFALQLVEEMRRLLEQLQDEMLTKVAIMKMEGHTNAEIAAATSVSVRTVIRKLDVIRSIWSRESAQ